VVGVVAVVVIFIGFAAFWVLVDVIGWRMGIQTWKRNLGIDIGIGLFDLTNAIWSTWHGDMGQACFWGALTGWMLWCAWDNWRRNRKRKGPLGRWFGRKVVDLGGKLAVVDIGPKEARA
jgi:hypothetical protein